MRDPLLIGCIVPMARAIVTGILVGIGAGAAGYWGRMEQYIAFAAFAGALGALAAWLNDWGVFRLLIAWLHAPIEPEYDEPEQETVIQAAPITITQDNGRTVQFMRFNGVSEEHLRRLADELTMGASFTNAYWDPRITRAEFETFRNELVKRGWAEQIRSDPQGGYRLTEQGMDGMRQIHARLADLPPTVNYGYYERV